MKSTLARYCVPALTLVLLGGVTLEAMMRPSPANADPYHARVKESVEAIPYRIGDWLGEDKPIVREAQALLKLNTMLSRRYRSMADGAEAELVIVQCRSARDMIGHYPPRCYPSNGYQAEGAQPMTWNIPGPDGKPTPISGYEYEFSFSSRDRGPRTVVVNFMVLPDGRFMPDMDAVVTASSDYLRYFFGAAQVQVVMSSTLPPERRRTVVNELVGPILPVLDVIRSGETR